MTVGTAVNRIAKELGYIGYDWYNYLTAVPLAVCTGAEFSLHGPSRGIQTGLVSLAILYIIGRVGSNIDVRLNPWGTAGDSVSSIDKVVSNT